MVYQKRLDAINESSKEFVTHKKFYKKPTLTVFGSITKLTQTNQGGPTFDGGQNPYHKGPS